MKHSITLAIALVLSVAMTGCATIDPYTGETKTSHTATGAGVGAVAGALVGLATGDSATSRRDRALAGAAVGALIGGAAGSHMDRKEQALRAKLAGTGVSVTRYEDRIVLNMPGNITFGTNESTVSPGFMPTLDSIALVLKKFPDSRMEIVGHTDSTGSVNYNKLLSERRAENVAAELRSRGVAHNRIKSRGAGPHEPVASNSTAAGREQNRRVELSLW